MGIFIKKQLICIGVVIAIVAVSAGVLVFNYFSTQDWEQMYAYIYSDNELIEVIDLTSVTEPYSFTIGDEESGYNVVQVEYKKIGMTDASCPDHVCVDTGFIESSLIPIVCLPNKIVIEIHSEGISEDGEESLDAVAQ